LAIVIMSGSMPKVSEPNALPVRQNPLITSSATNSTSYFLRIGWIFSK